MRNPYTIVPRHSKPASLLARNPIYKAFAAKPIPVALQTLQAIDARESYIAAIEGKATPDDRETLAGVSNCVMVLSEKHCTPADLADAQAAQMALLRADARAICGKTWALDGEGMKSVLGVIELFEDVIARIGQGAVADALITVMHRDSIGHVHRLETA